MTLPRPLYGCLSPGETSIRRLPAMPRGTSFVFKGYGPGRRRLFLVEHDDDDGHPAISIQNTSGFFVPYVVFFARPGQTAKIAALKQVFDAFARPPKGSPDGA